MTAALLVHRAGASTTIQDCGRVGHQSSGVPVSGALDRVALAAANIVVGNPPGEAALEILMLGPEFEIVGESVRLALAASGGGRLEVGAAVAGSEWRRVPALTSVRLTRGERVRVAGLGVSAMAYLAIEGGIAVPSVLGSRSTYVRAGLGGLDGRRLAAGDRVPLRLGAALERSERQGAGLDLEQPSRLHVMMGPESRWFPDDAAAALLASSYSVTAASDRMGLRLAGPRIARCDGADSLLSAPIAAGSIQIPPDGQPILLLADRQTIGGYPKIATVVSADVPLAGRLAAGHAIRFVAISRAEAIDRRRALEAALARFAAAVAEVPPWSVAGAAAGHGGEAGADPVRLAAENLVSGVVSADEG